MKANFLLVLDRFLNESRCLVFGDLLRPSFSSALYLPLTPLPTNTHLINSPGSLVTSWILIDLHQFVSHQGFPEQRCLCHIIHNIYALIRLGKTARKVSATALVTGPKDTKQQERRRKSREKDRKRLMIKGKGFKW